MKNEIQVSVIVATYNSNINKIMNTLTMACNQKDISYEIIVTDDGSEHFDKEEIVKIFKLYEFNNYMIISNPVNQGTVKNLLNASKKALGKYLFFTSPGDILFSKTSLKEFFEYIDNNKTKICFGDYVEYCAINKKVKILQRRNWPLITGVYEKKQKIYKTAYCFGDQITGSSIIREKNYAIKSLEYILDKAKYVEDNTTICYAMVENQPISYFNKKIIWYDRGEGVSQDNNVEWGDILWNEVKTVKEHLIDDYPKDRVLKVGYKAYYGVYGRWTNIILLLLHPIICFRKINTKRLPEHITICSENEKKELEKILNE